MKKINIKPGTSAAMAAYLCHKGSKPYKHDGIKCRISSMTPKGDRLQVELMPEK